METIEKGLVLEDGHLYTQFSGLYLFRAHASPDQPGAWLLQRLNPEDGQRWSAKPGDMIGYMRTADGLWWHCNAGDPAVDGGKDKIHRAHWPVNLSTNYWEHAGTNLDDFGLNEMMRDLNI